MTENPRPRHAAPSRTPRHAAFGVVRAPVALLAVGPAGAAAREGAPGGVAGPDADGIAVLEHDGSGTGRPVLRVLPPLPEHAAVDRPGRSAGRIRPHPRRRAEESTEPDLSAVVDLPNVSNLPAMPVLPDLSALSRLPALQDLPALSDGEPLDTRHGAGVPLRRPRPASPGRDALPAPGAVVDRSPCPVPMPLCSAGIGGPAGDHGMAPSGSRATADGVSFGDLLADLI